MEKGNPELREAMIIKMKMYNSSDSVQIPFVRLETD